MRFSKDLSHARIAENTIGRILAMTALLVLAWMSY